jgi:21S rRNA (uridine2791-2'-O)-methyltransferase
LDPNRGRSRDQFLQIKAEEQQQHGLKSTVEQESYIDMMRPSEAESVFHRNINSTSTISGSGSKVLDDVGKMVDVVLSDMSAPWEQTTGFWKKSLSSPYNRMMNTSGINFRDHAGSMVGYIVH